ncbi:hypothetical protein VTN77DRAFT_5262 [Rasamsonia byssochlamydoides]|uniref:uncharacterized protein n=1 Tax=Rasamsonia byssochlamydoides TaxID=89139 RepID=UPI003744A392
MFENGIFGFFKSSSKEESAPQQTWNPNTMTMEQPTNYAGNQEVVTEQPASQEPMKLRGGGEAGEVCCGVCAGLLCFECCEECC